jgi:D-alanine-D-alanine ligase
MSKIKVAVLFGGRSGEHEVSLMSAVSIIKAMDKEKYDIIPMGITREGQWILYKGSVDEIASGKWEGISNSLLEQDANNGINILSSNKEDNKFVTVEQQEVQGNIDIVFPVLHGTYGEDGTVQGFLEIANIPYVGAGVLPSALGMDKIFTKAVFKAFDIPQGKYMGVTKSDLNNNMELILDEIEKNFHYPIFIKPSNMGSSVGISKAKDRGQLRESLLNAAKYDRKILVEEFINCREIECSVLGNENPIASVPGEIVPSKEFYDYEAKYFDGGKSRILIPAPLTQEQSSIIKELALRAYKALDCNGMARVDFFIDKNDGRILINEVNTIPGFTSISMYPKMWEASGIPYSKLIDILIDLGLERYKEKNSLYIKPE